MTLTAIVLTVFLSAGKSDAIRFSGYEWHYYWAYAPATFDGITFKGFDPNSGWWFNASDVIVTGTDPNNDSLHLKFIRRPNPYFRHTGKNTANAGIYNFLVAKRDTFIQRGERDSLQICQNFIDGMTDSLIWYGSYIMTDSVLRYGRYEWQLANRIDTLDDAIAPGLWMGDDANVQQADNELSFEFSKHRLPKVEKLTVSVLPYMGPDGKYKERNTTLRWEWDKRSLGSKHYIIYKPESVYFHSSWYKTPGDSSFWRYNSTIERVGYPGNGGPNRSNPTQTTGPLATPHCGNLNFARISILKLNSINNATYKGRDSIEMVVKSFHWTGIPDLSFTDTLGAPWPWIQSNQWHPNGWNAPVVVTSCPTSHEGDTVFTHDQQLYLSWAVHNIGTDTVRANSSIRTSCILDDSLCHNWIARVGTGQNNLSPQYPDSYFTNGSPFILGATGSDHFTLPRLSVGRHTIRVITNADSSFEELQRKNNSYSVTIRIVAFNLDFRNVNRMPTVNSHTQNQV